MKVTLASVPQRVLLGAQFQKCNTGRRKGATEELDAIKNCIENPENKDKNKDKIPLCLRVLSVFSAFSIQSHAMKDMARLARLTWSQNSVQCHRKCGGRKLASMTTVFLFISFFFKVICFLGFLCLYLGQDSVRS